MVLFFFAVIVPVVVLKNAGRALPRWMFEARCEQTYRQSDSPQYSVPGFSYLYFERSTGFPPRMDPVSQARRRNTPSTHARMVVTDFSRAWGPDEDPPREVLTCRTDLQGRTHLRPFR